MIKFEYLYMLLNFGINGAIWLYFNEEKGGR